MTAQPFTAPYFLSKRALEAYNDSLRRELMYLGIPVIKIQPGSFDTSLTRSIYNKFDITVQSTKYYKKILTKMKPLMDWELSRKHNPARLVRTLMHALESKTPKLNYKVGTGWLLALLELLPEKGVDNIYQLIFNRNK